MTRIALTMLALVACGCSEQISAPRPVERQADTESYAPSLQLVPHNPEQAALKSARADLLKELNEKPYYISDQRVVDAIASVPREEFCMPENRHLAYLNRALPIRYGQTISQPYIVALMTQEMEPKPTDKVLEVGTGSGYQAAVLSPLVKHVYTIEIVEELAKEASERLDRLGYDNVSVKSGDGFRGWPENAPYDSIIVTCAPTEVPQPLVDQLAEGGRMVIPVGEFQQELVVLKKRDGEIQQEVILSVLFVPMTGEAMD